jgi:hypothetical protein
MRNAGAIFLTLYILFFGSTHSFGNCFNFARNIAHRLGMAHKPEIPPEVRFKDSVLNDLVVPVLVQAGWAPEALLEVKNYSAALKQLNRLRRDPRVLSLFEVPHRPQGLLGQRLISPSRQEGRPANALEIFSDHILELKKKYGPLLAKLEADCGVSERDVLGTYLRYAKVSMGLIVDHIDERARLFQEKGLNLKNSLLMAIALGHVPTQELRDALPLIAKTLNAKHEVAKEVFEQPLETFTEADFIVSYGTRFGNIPIREIAEVAPSIHLASHAVGRGALSFLEVLARLDSRLTDALFRMGDPLINPQFRAFLPDHEHTLVSMNPWKAFKERIAWSFENRKIINEEAVRKIRNVFLIDQIYTLICESLVRGTAILTDEYQRLKFITNLVTFGLNDFVLGWTGVETASDSLRKSKIWKEARTRFLENRVNEFREGRRYLAFLAAKKDLTLDQLRSRLTENPGYLNKLGAFGFEFTERGQMLFKSGFLTTGVGISALQLFSATFEPDPEIEVEDRVITVLWTSFMVATWMATSSNIRYSLVLEKLQRYWEQKFPTKLRNMDPQVVKVNQSKQIFRTRVAGGVNAMVGGIGFIVAWQNWLDPWFEQEDGLRDDMEAVWDEFEEWLLKDF